MGDNPENILYIDPSSSQCGACGIECHPHERAHITSAGYAHNGKPGCGIEYTHVSSHYMGDGIKEAAMKMRADLPWYPRIFERKVSFDDEPDDRPLRVVKMVPVDEFKDTW